YEKFAATGVRNITGYNQLIQQKNAEDGENRPILPFIVVIVDELADLMMVASNEVEDAIIRLAQMARAAGIHMILATQRPS
ncbi:FtsK/SpoIIIE domain-containing protein, partial [Escherichia coli]|nr:FtsK/SpoIIIE domain-containing protein [Escherichia coli]